MTHKLSEQELVRRKALRQLRKLREQLLRLKFRYPSTYYSLLAKGTEETFYDSMDWTEQRLLKLGERYATRTTKENA